MIEPALLALRLRLALRPNRPVVHRQDGRLVVFDGLRILPYITGVIDPARQFAEVPVLDRFQAADVDLGGFRNLLEREAAIAANRGQSEDAFLFLHENRQYNITTA